MLNHRDNIEVFIKANNRYFGLFNVVQLGKNGVVDLKITDLFNKMILSPVGHRDRGYFVESDLADTRFIRRMEMSYHKDGSLLYKFNNEGIDRYKNPRGEGNRWVATSDISDFHPIMTMAIRRVSICKCLQDIKVESRNQIYVCENDELFGIDGGYFVVLYVRNKLWPICRYSTPKLYSDRLVELSESIDLCMFIRKCSYTKPQSYYSEEFKGNITPYLYNSFKFCDDEALKSEIRKDFANTVFSLDLNNGLEQIGGGEFVLLSEDKIKIMCEIDALYRYCADPPMGKFQFINKVLNMEEGQLFAFFKLDSLQKQQCLKRWLYES